MEKQINKTVYLVIKCMDQILDGQTAGSHLNYEWNLMIFTTLTGDDLQLMPRGNHTDNLHLVK